MRLHRDKSVRPAPALAAGPVVLSSYAAVPRGSDKARSRGSPWFEFFYQLLAAIDQRLAAMELARVADTREDLRRFLHGVLAAPFPAPGERVRIVLPPELDQYPATVPDNLVRPAETENGGLEHVRPRRCNAAARGLRLMPHARRHAPARSHARRRSTFRSCSAASTTRPSCASLRPFCASGVCCSSRRR